jgi:hypothetical protein
MHVVVPILEGRCLLRSNNVAIRFAIQPDHSICPPLPGSRGVVRLCPMPEWRCLRGAEHVQLFSDGRLDWGYVLYPK